MEQVECQSHANLTITNVYDHVDEPLITLPDPLSLTEANTHLNMGYGNNFGEAVILYKLDDQGHVVDLVKVNSFGYQYRFALRANDPNTYHRFFELLNDSYTSLAYYTNYLDFKDKYLIYKDYNKEDLEQLDNVCNLEQVELTDEQKKDRNYILKMIWLNYIVSLPVTSQKEAFGFYDKLIKERQELISYLQSKINEQEGLSERGKNIITAAITTSKQKKGDLQFTKEVIKNFVNKEKGASLYSLIKHMKN